MVLIVEMISLLGVALGLYGLAKPDRVTGLVARLQSEAGLWTAFAVRLLFGLALWWAAPLSRMPVVLQIVAAISVLSGLALRFAGAERYIALLSWWCRQPPTFLRAWMTMAVILCFFILWSVAL